MKLRTEKILNSLLFSHEIITIEDLAKEHKIGIRTIQNDIAEINDFLKKLSFNSVENTQNKGLVLKLSDKDTQIVHDLLNRSENRKEIYWNKDIRIFHLILELTLGNSFYLYEKEKEFDISKSTLDSDMRELRKLLESYNLELKSDLKEGLQLIGSEQKVRTMIFDQIFENLETTDIFDKSKHLLSEYQVFFKFISLDFISKLNNYYRDFHKEYNYLYKNQILIMLSIWILRNNELLSKNNLYENNNEESTELFIGKIIKEFKLNPNNEEIKYINLILNALSHDLDINPSDWIEVQIFTINLINKLQRTLDFSFDKDLNNLFKSLFEHNIRLHTRIKKDIQLYNPLTESIKNDYNELFKIIQNYFDFHTKSKKYQVKDDEIAFIVIHFLAAQSRQKQIKKSVFRAVIFCNYGLATGTLLAETLQQYFPIEIVATLNMNELYLLEKLDYDVIFSTKTLNIDRDAYLVVPPIMDERNIKNIEEYLEKKEDYKSFYFRDDEIKAKNLLTEVVDLVKDEYGSLRPEFVDEIFAVFKKNNLSMDIKEIQPMIKDILSDDNIILNLKVNNWREAISKTAEPLLINNTIEDSYVDSMINSVVENGPYIVLGNGLALAHARPEDGVNKLGLSVATLDSPIDFDPDNEHWVDIVFCLAAIDSHSHLNIIKSLVNLINDDMTLSKIKSSENIEEFKKNLFKK